MTAKSDVATSYEATQYSPKGLMGVLTPQANTTAEMELSMLLPQGFGMATARVVSTKSGMSDRLVDYVDQQNAALDQFANAPISAAIFACTGAAYLVDPDAEQAKRAEIEAARGYPFVTAADAVADALKTLGVSRVGLVSPYGDDLHEKSLTYWAKRNLVPIAIHRIAGKSAAFHPIYSTPASQAASGYRDMAQNDVDCVLFLGTGLPTLPVIAEHGDGALPILSPNLCLMWRAWTAVTGQELTSDGLKAWLGSNAHWVPRFQQWTQGSEA